MKRTFFLFLGSLSSFCPSLLLSLSTCGGCRIWGSAARVAQLRGNFPDGCLRESELKMLFACLFLSNSEQRACMLETDVFYSKETQRSILPVRSGTCWRWWWWWWGGINELLEKKKKKVTLRFQHLHLSHPGLLV